MNIKCWLRVADDCFPASNFSSSWSLGSVQSGELAALQVDLRKYLARKPGWTRCVVISIYIKLSPDYEYESELRGCESWDIY